MLYSIPQEPSTNMGNEYVDRMMDRVRTPSPRPDHAESEQAVNGWQDYAANSR
jgi:hypothetical protein